jgi:hypothetical protein
MPSNNALNLADASRSGWCYGLTSASPFGDRRPQVSAGVLRTQRAGERRIV